MEEFQQYEFSSSQNELIKQLAEKMRFVAYFLIGVGVLIAISGLFTLLRGGIGNIINGVVQIIIGVWTKAACKNKLNNFLSVVRAGKPAQARRLHYLFLQDS